MQYVHEAMITVKFVKTKPVMQYVHEAMITVKFVKTKPVMH